MNAYWLLGVLLTLPWWQMEEEARLQHWRKSAQHSLQQRVLKISAGFLGTPYAFSPLGEGEGVDADPLFRWDFVDCLTFVEETMALSLASNWEEVLPLLNDIRYAQGKPHYETRNHLMEAQWVPFNLKKGYLKSLSASFAKGQVKRVQKQWTPTTWEYAEGRALGLPAHVRPLGYFSMEMIPLAHALPLLSTLPEGSLILFIQADLPKRITRIRHLGFLVHAPQAPMLRHASRTFKKVVDEPIENYIRRNLAHASWTLEGIAVYEVQRPPKLKSEESMQKPPATKSAGEP